MSSPLNDIQSQKDFEDDEDVNMEDLLLQSMFEENNKITSDSGVSLSLTKEPKEKMDQVEKSNDKADKPVEAEKEITCSSNQGNHSIQIGNYATCEKMNQNDNDKTCDKTEKPIEPEEEITYSSNEEIQSIQVGNYATEVIGYVKSIWASKNCGDRGQYQRMVFTVSNEADCVIHCTVWQEEIPRIEPNLILNSVVCIAGAEIAAFKYPEYNKGNQDFDMIIRKQTTVTCLSEQRKLNIIPKEEGKLVSFNNLKSENGCIKIRGFVKSTFRLLRYDIANDVIHYGLGSITNGEFKVDIRITNFTEKQELFQKGDHVEVHGFLKFTKKSKIVYIKIEDANAITIVDNEKMSFEDLLQGYKVIIKENLSLPG